MEPEIATALIAAHMDLAEKVRVELNKFLEAPEHLGLSQKSILVAMLIHSASIADRTHMKDYDFLQLADTAYQVIDSGGRPAA